MAHPVRGNFGDPRTIFVAGLEGGPGALGSFTFHNGIDISAPDGTEVYPVVSGNVVNVTGQHITVRTADHRHFQYWHIRPAVRLGQSVVADETILGRILPGAEHVHLTEIDRFRATNPLVPGHIFPYRDDKPPRVDALHFLDADGHELSGPDVHGTVAVTVSAHDDPSLLPADHWRDAVVTPALVRWWLSRRDRSLVWSPRTAFDVRSTIPLNREFWDVYAPGTFQNFPESEGRHVEVTGNYIFRITDLDTDRLPVGEYRLTVEATDVCGNSGTLARTFLVSR